MDEMCSGQRARDESRLEKIHWPGGAGLRTAMMKREAATRRRPVALAIDPVTTGLDVDIIPPCPCSCFRRSDAHVQSFRSIRVRSMPPLDYKPDATKLRLMSAHAKL